MPWAFLADGRDPAIVVEGAWLVVGRIYLGDDAEFYLRMGNSTRLYNTRVAMEYIRSRW